MAAKRRSDMDSSAEKKRGNSTPIINVPSWIEENKKFFLPPVCNKMMHQAGQMKLFFVGGPNQRKDYHIECGEELFYMLKGDMVLKVVEHGKHRDVKIRQGEMFLLPSKIAHSPQRYENTVGIVLERDRATCELDGLRYFVEEDGVPILNSLYESWFYCTDLGTQLAPVIKAFFASEQCKTGTPLPGTIPENPPIILDAKRDLEDPLVFEDWLKDNKDEIDKNGKKRIYNGDYQFQVFVYGKGENSDECEVAEIFLWQWTGESTLTVAGRECQLKKDDSFLVPEGQRFTVKQDAGSRMLVAYQDPRKSSTWKP